MLPLIIAVLLIVVDQVTKYLALTNLKPIGTMVFLEGFMDFTFVENRGVAFGLFSEQRWPILILTTAITIGLIWYYLNLPKAKAYHWVRVALVLIFSGAVGNIIDRFVRGYVVDFFEFTFFSWPVFNVADIYVVVGVVLMAFMIMFVIKETDEK